MIRHVTLEASEYAEAPHRFEAGTPPIAQAVGLAAAIEWLDGVGWDAIAAHEAELSEHLATMLAGIPRVRRIGVSTPPRRRRASPPRPPD